MARSPARQAAGPECAILSNEAALHSLKRAQLLALCKQHSLKGSGKNVDLIARLQERGRDLLEQASDASMTEENGDTSTASWAIVSQHVPAQLAESREFGGQTTTTREAIATDSITSSSLTSTLRTAGASLYRTLVSSNPNESLAGPAPFPDAQTSTEAPSAHLGIYPSLRSLQAGDDQYSTAPAPEEAPLGGIRPVSRRSLMAEQPVPRAIEGYALPRTSPFVFGSPAKERPSTAPVSAFTFSMPGALFASTSSTASVSDEQEQPSLSAVQSLQEEMNRRALEAKAAAEAAGIKRSQSFLVDSTSASGELTSATTAATKKAAFDISHKRTFEKMDSIANHWAAKRKIASTGDVVSMARSSSARSLSAPDHKDERAAKRQKPGPRAKAQDGSSRDRQVIAALRESGWSNVTDKQATASRAESARTGMITFSRAAKIGEVGPTEDVAEQTRRKRQLELAKARRKSGAATGAGIAKRRPSLGVGPTPSRSTAARLFRSTVRKLASTVSVPALPSTVASGQPASERALPTAPQRQPIVPRFAAPTASTASRAALTAATSPVKSTRLISPLKQSARKAFDLQASLKRPITWQSHLQSPMVQASPSASRAATSTTVPVPLNKPLEPAQGSSKALRHDSAQDLAAERTLLSLPPAPSSAFTLAPSPGASTSSSGWQPPAITRSPLLPTTPNAERKVSSRPAPSTKKTISASSRAARSEDKARTRKGVEGVEARARMVRAKAAAAKARANPQ